MTSKQILDYVKNHPSQKVKVAVADIDGILRGKYIVLKNFFPLLIPVSVSVMLFLVGMPMIWPMITALIPVGIQVIPMRKRELI